jgi:mRNA-degrading endonuclease RelE of RelBE toxin-antitoxin system
MRRVRKTKRYHKSLWVLPEKDQDVVEAAVDRLEGDWKRLDFAPIQGTKDWWRLSLGHYRVFCRVLVQSEPQSLGARTIVVRVQEIEADEVVRRSTTTYRKRN